MDTLVQQKIFVDVLTCRLTETNNVDRPTRHLFHSADGVATGSQPNCGSLDRFIFLLDWLTNRFTRPASPEMIFALWTINVQATRLVGFSMQPPAPSALSSSARPSSNLHARPPTLSGLSYFPASSATSSTNPHIRPLPPGLAALRFDNDEPGRPSLQPLVRGLRTLSSPIILQFSSQITVQLLNSPFSVRTQVHSDGTKAHLNDHPLERFARMLGRIYSDG